MIELQKFRSMLEASQKAYVNNIPRIKINNPILGEIHTKHIKDSFNPSYITTELRNSVGNLLGKELFSLEEGNPKSMGLTMEVEQEYREKGFKFGEILRLSSIMMIIQNKIKEFEIYSKHSAIYFHSRYMFEPAITNFQERDSALQSIIKNCEGKEEYKEFQREAEEILENSFTHKDAKIQRDLCNETNILLKKYIAKVLEKKSEYREHPFSTGITMKLTDNNIFINKNFFNNLFKKHNIDYKI